MVKDGGLPLTPGQAQGTTGATPGGPGAAAAAPGAGKGPSIKIDSPKDAGKTSDGGALFSITAAPAMPVIQATASIVGVTTGLDPTPTTEFEWTATVSFDSGNCPNGIAIKSDLYDAGDTRTIPAITSKGKVTGGKIVVSFNKIRGGTLTLTVTAKVGGLTVSGETKGWRIQGTNPSKADVGGAMPSDTCRKIACAESQMRQFYPAKDEGNALYPYFSEDRLLGIGICQLTDPQPTEDQVWNWRENVKAGVALYNDKKRLAKPYPQKVAKSQKFQALVKRYNDNLNKSPARASDEIDIIYPGGPRPPITPAPPTLGPVTVSVPEFTEAQLEDDTIRAFNGYAGMDAFGFHLHEFRIQVSPVTNDLDVDGDPKTGKVMAKWERVPVADRPSAGDPNYVDNVKNRDPGTCASQ